MSKSIITSRETLLFVLGLFFMNPFLGVMLTFNILFSNISVNKLKLTKVFSVFLAVFLGFINSTKIPENDLIYHGSVYLRSGEYNFFEYLLHTGKEPVYYSFNYLFYHFSGGSFKFWVIAFSVFSYLLLFAALIKYFRKIKATESQLIFALILAAFFPQLFSLSAHLIRQFIAGAIFMYFAVDKIFYKNNKWWLVIAGALTHSSSLLLFPLVYFKFFGDFKKYRVLNIIVIVVLFSYQHIARLLLSLLKGFNENLTYILTRASGDTTFDLGNFQLLNYIMMFALIIIVLFYMQHHRKRLAKIKFSSTNRVLGFIENQQMINNSQKRFFSIMIFLSLFILANINQSELSNRLFFYIFFYFPFIIPLFTGRLKNSNLFSYVFSILFMLFFTYRLVNGVWTYASLYDIITNNFFTYLFKADFII